MKKRLIAGALVITAAFGTAAAVMWHETPVDYQPITLTEAQILAEKPVYCEGLSGSLKESCERTSEALHWKIGAIRRLCYQKTLPLKDGGLDYIGSARADIEQWRCLTQFVAVNGNDIQDLPVTTRPRAVSDAWKNLRFHWQSNGLSRPLDFAAATTKTIRFSLGH